MTGSSGREPAAVRWQRYRRPSFTASPSSPRRRRESEAAAAARNKWLSLVTARTPSTICGLAKNLTAAVIRALLADSGPVTPKRAIVFCCLPLSTAFRGRALEASILPLEVSGLSPSLHLRLSGWRAAAAPRPNSLSEGSINWYGRSGLAPSGDIYLAINITNGENHPGWGSRLRCACPHSPAPRTAWAFSHRTHALGSPEGASFPVLGTSPLSFPKRKEPRERLGVLEVS